MKVSLLSHTPNVEALIAAAAKLCYSSKGIDDIYDPNDDEGNREFLNKLIDLGHESPLEHVTFTFAIEGISRSCSHQLVRHRIASYSQKSQRYVTEEGFDYVTPELLKEYPEMLDLYNNTMKQLADVYSTMLNTISDEMAGAFAQFQTDYTFNKMKEKYKKQIAEDIRFVLPNACCTSIVVTMNIRSLFNFFKHRCCNRAQWEIREVANEMYNLCNEISPTIFKHAGPSCKTTGKCSEGKMFCGKPQKAI